MAEANPTVDANLTREVSRQLSGLAPAANLPKNPKRVIRTYASDAAMLSGKPQAAAPASVSAPPPPARPAPPAVERKPAQSQSLAEAVAGIQLPRATPVQPPPAPTIEKQPEPMFVSRPEQAPPPVPLQKRAPEPSKAPAEARIVSESIVSEKDKPSFFARLFASLFGSKPVQPSAPTTWAPVPKAPEPVAPASYLRPTSTESLMPQAPAGEDREAILARLRGRVASYQASNAEPAPVFPAPKPEAAPKPAPRPIPQPIAPRRPEPEVPERLQTYASDFSSRINTQSASAFSVLAAEQDAGKAGVSAPHQSHGLLYALISAVLVIGGSLILYYAYGYLQSNAPVPIANSGLPASLIAPDETSTVSGTGAALMGSIAGEAAKALGVGNVRTLYLGVSTTSATGAQTTLARPGGALIVALQLPAPDILLRNINDDSTVGIVHAGDETRAFFILDADSYERVFAGMLSWEPTIGRDLSALYPAYADVMATAATSTATSTASQNPPAAISLPGFKDEVVSSHDVRALKDGEGRTVLLYGFRDQNTLIIARDETAFAVLLARLSATASK